MACGSTRNALANRVSTAGSLAFVSYLPEIPEADATGRVAELYDDIRAVLGLPLVNLVYRHLAALGCLEAAWTQLRPNLSDAAVDAAANELIAPARIDFPPFSAAALEAVGLRHSEVATLLETFAAYNHANPRNLLALCALLNGVSEKRLSEVTPVERRPEFSQLLPMPAQCRRWSGSRGPSSRCCVRPLRRSSLPVTR
jgi:hypothetical protein